MYVPFSDDVIANSSGIELIEGHDMGPIIYVPFNDSSSVCDSVDNPIAPEDDVIANNSGILVKLFEIYDIDPCPPEDDLIVL